MANQFSINVDQSNDRIKVVSVPKTWLEGGNTPNWITPVVNYGMTSGGILIPQRVDSEGRPEITQYGTMVSSGLLANRPLASAVPPGFAYYSWDAPEGQEMAYSNGTNWEVKS